MNDKCKVIDDKTFELIVRALRMSGRTHRGAPGQHGRLCIECHDSVRSCNRLSRQGNTFCSAGTSRLALKALGLRQTRRFR